MVRGKQNLFDKPTPEQLALMERMARRRERSMRRQCDMLGFWKACAVSRCRRARGCSGDPEQCFADKWRHVPEDIKEWFRGAILAKMNGARTVKELEEAADARRATYLEFQEKYAGMRSSPQREPAAPPEPAPRAKRP